MQALMGKSSKAPTAQELYKARKQKEEEERNAFLPPGLVNHGNTCFMNSVLQGLMATPMLADIVRFSLPEIYAPVSSRRSPQLTNGHRLGGEVDREWEKGMPLGDTFVQLMQKAWKIQDERRRQSMSPKELLTRIGAKFDQYLDFRQQDAHEFLRHLLDAMRMEELDIIKQRQPLPPKAKRRRKSRSKSEIRDASSYPAEIPEDERLVSFVDMVFGGRLASILVCEKCKHISWTYEDFNDLSLSIKQEDYEKSKKRDRLKTLARKLGMRGRNRTRELEIPDGPRSNSVPSSPLRRSEEAEKSFELVLGDVGQRRRSLEAGEVTPSLTTTFHEETSIEGGETTGEQKLSDDNRMLGVPEEHKPSDEDDPHEREKDKDSWVKLRRKISVGVGVKKSHKKKARVSKDAPSELPSHDESQANATTGDEVLDSFMDVKAPSPIPASPSISPLLGATLSLQRLSFGRRVSSSRAETNSPALSAVTSPSRSPDIPPVLLPPQETRPSSPSLVPASTAPSAEQARPKSPRPSKPTRSDSAYLRRLLADIPAIATSGSSTYFNLFRTGTLASSSPDMSDIRGAWPKSGHVQSVEECLRMFTAVEVLDGENMVGCRKCWKMQNVEHVPREMRSEKREGDEEEEEDVDEDDEDDDANSDSSTSVKINLVNSDDLPTPERLLGSNTPLTSSIELNERMSIHSAPPPVSPNDRSLISDDSGTAANLNVGTSPSPALPVPSISMTGPESAPSTSEQTPTSEAFFQNTSHNESSVRLVSSPSRDSLQLPTTTRHFRQAAERSSRLSITSDTSSLSSDESDDEAEETETSMTASMRSDSSSIASTHMEPPGLSRVSTLVDSSAKHASDRSLSNSHRNTKDRKGGSKVKGIPWSKQVIMRRAYKRYLIATPPPVLVVHLKRFQQVGRTPAQLQFFANFKKLDDPVNFPEYLDLSPFLLPSKDEVKRESDKRKRKSKDEKDGAGGAYMYRLYAVVVHIGNMLGGHYVAYTALPEASVLPSTKDKESFPLPASKLTTTDSVRPEVPRTTSFSRTANPHSHSSSKSRTSSSSTASNSGAQRQWCYVSDTIVRLATLEEVLQAKAYICMYERI